MKQKGLYDYKHKWCMDRINALEEELFQLKAENEELRSKNTTCEGCENLNIDPYLADCLECKRKVKDNYTKGE